MYRSGSGRADLRRAPWGSPHEKKALEDILDQEYETLPSYDKLLDRLKIAVFRDVLTGSIQPLEKNCLHSGIRSMPVQKAETPWN